MSVYRPPPPVSKSDLLNAATRRLFEMMCTHSCIGCWILLSQLLFRALTPMASVFLMNLNLLLLAERSWKVQSRTMPIWHPVVQTFFCVSRMVHGAAAILSVVLWGKVMLLCGRGGWC